VVTGEGEHGVFRDLMILLNHSPSPVYGEVAGPVDRFRKRARAINGR
jgi:hypothetical protein